MSGNRSPGCPGNAVRAAALRVYALDAAFPFDFEHKAKVLLERQTKLRVGIVGFGTFGQFLARRLVAAGHEVCAQPPGLVACTGSSTCFRRCSYTTKQYGPQRCVSG